MGVVAPVLDLVDTVRRDDEVVACDTVVGSCLVVVGASTVTVVKSVVSDSLGFASAVVVHVVVFSIVL